jgi:hypothetical protein
LVHGDSGGNWSLEFQRAEAIVNEFDTTMKVSKCMFYVKDGLKIANGTYWVLECCVYGRSFAWE